MYMAWAERRNMRVEALEQDAAHGVARLAVSGFGALTLLEGEQGLHQFEFDGSDGATHRVAIAVRVAPCLLYTSRCV